MRNPFNFESEPFEFYSEFDEYEEGQSAKPCQCHKRLRNNAEFSEEYQEEQPDTYSEFGEEYESDFEGETFETYPEFEDAYEEALDLPEFEFSQEQAQKMLKDFLGKIRKHPQDFKELLFVAHFHPHPTMVAVVLTKGLLLSDLLDLLKGNTAEQVDRDLIEISAKFYHANVGFQRQVDEEEKHLREIRAFTEKLLRSKDSWPFLIDAALLAPKPEKFSDLGRNFAFKALPPGLYQWIMKSKANEAHYFELFRGLKKKATSNLVGDELFKAEVERARKESEQAWKELKKQVQNIQESKCVPLIVDNFSPGKSNLNDYIIKRLKVIVKIIALRSNPAKQLKGKIATLQMNLDFEGHVDKATDPKKYKSLDYERAQKVGVSLRDMLQKATERLLPLGIYYVWNVNFSTAGPGRPRSSKPHENRRVEVCVRGLELFE